MGTPALGGVQPPLCNECAQVEPEAFCVGGDGDIQGGGGGGDVREQEKNVAVVGGPLLGVWGDVREVGSGSDACNSARGREGDVGSVWQG